MPVKDLFVARKEERFCPPKGSGTQKEVGFQKSELSLVLLIVNPIALRIAKTPYSFGYSECKRVKWLFVLVYGYTVMFFWHFSKRETTFMTFCMLPQTKSPFQNGTSLKGLLSCFLHFFLKYYLFKTCIYERSRLLKM